MGVMEAPTCLCVGCCLASACLGFLCSFKSRYMLSKSDCCDMLRCVVCLVLRVFVVKSKFAEVGIVRIAG